LLHTGIGTGTVGFNVPRNTLQVILEIIFPASNLTGASKNKYNHNQLTTQKPEQQLMKTTNVCKTKPNETKAYFRSSIMPSGQETDRTYYIAP